MRYPPRMIFPSRLRVEARPGLRPSRRSTGSRFSRPAPRSQCTPPQARLADRCGQPGTPRTSTQAPPPRGDFGLRVKRYFLGGLQTTGLRTSCGEPCETTMHRRSGRVGVT
jgi:hypothetical protein